MYIITDYTKKQAKINNVIVKPSINTKKKLDVFNKKGDKLASIGAIGYMDYPNYMKSRGKAYADERRRLYKIRHAKEIKIKDGKFTPSHWADVLLW